MNFRTSLSFFAVVVLALAIANTVHADVIFFDGFEADAPDVLDSTLVNWNIPSGSIDVLSPGNLCGSAGSFSNCLDMDGTSFVKGAANIQTKTTFNLDPGAYRLSFDVAGAWRNFPTIDTIPNVLTAGFGALTFGSIGVSTFDPFQTIVSEFDLFAPTSGKIFFAHTGPDWVGALLDNVKFESFERPVEPPTPVPEPTSIVTLGLGLLFAAGMYKRWGVNNHN